MKNDYSTIMPGEPLCAVAWHIDGCDIVIAARTEAELLFATRKLGLEVDLTRCARIEIRKAEATTHRKAGE